MAIDKRFTIIPCLRKYMKLKDISIGQLASEAGTSRTPINRALRGLRINKQIAVRICEAFHRIKTTRDKRGIML